MWVEIRHFATTQTQTHTHSFSVCTPGVASRDSCHLLHGFEAAVWCECTLCVAPFAEQLDWLLHPSCELHSYSSNCHLLAAWTSFFFTFWVRNPIIFPSISIWILSRSTCNVSLMLQDWKRTHLSPLGCLITGGSLQRLTCSVLQRNAVGAGHSQGIVPRFTVYCSLWSLFCIVSVRKLIALYFEKGQGETRCLLLHAPANVWLTWSCWREKAWEIQGQIFRHITHCHILYQFLDPVKSLPSSSSDFHLLSASSVHPRGAFGFPLSGAHSPSANLITVITSNP